MEVPSVRVFGLCKCRCCQTVWELVNTVPSARYWLHHASLINHAFSPMLTTLALFSCNVNAIWNNLGKPLKYWKIFRKTFHAQKYTFLGNLPTAKWSANPSEECCTTRKVLNHAAVVAMYCLSARSSVIWTRVDTFVYSLRDLELSSAH